LLGHDEVDRDDRIVLTRSSDGAMPDPRLTAEHESRGDHRVGEQRLVREASRVEGKIGVGRVRLVAGMRSMVRR
jgi:hypothetical protein